MPGFIWVFTGPTLLHPFLPIQNTPPGHTFPGQIPSLFMVPSPKNVKNVGVLPRMAFGLPGSFLHSFLGLLYAFFSLFYLSLVTVIVTGKALA